jgi:hypothetical protein
VVSHDTTKGETSILLSLGGIVLAYLPLDTRIAGSNPAKDDEFLRAIRIHSTTSFLGEVKPSISCRKIFSAC